MTKDLQQIQTTLVDILGQHIPPLRFRHNSPEKVEACGTFPTMQGKQKVDGFYFASVIPKPKDIRLYFFPIYTNKEAFQLSDQLQKCLKGKSCFHFKKLDEDLIDELRGMIRTGVDVYQKEGLI